MVREKHLSTYRGKYPKACSNCKRRKERCDGRFPCERCVYRNVASECQPVAPKRRDSAPAGNAQTTSPHPNVDAGPVDGANDSDGLLYQLELQTFNQTDDSCRDWAFCDSPAASMHGQMSRMLRDPRGKYMFIGDSANLSFLQSIRKLVECSVGPCTFTRDPLRYQLVEATPADQSSLLQANAGQLASTFTLEQATYLIRRYFLATNCVLDLFDEADLLEKLPAWLGRSIPAEMDMLTPIYYLIFAVGAQTCPEDKDDLAQTCFNHGRYFSLSEDPSISTVQAYALITMYLLNASRRNAAFMNLGTAVRAAYALGLHRREIAALFPPAEFKTRERLWRVIRILDLFMSTSLGRPPSTSETRDTRATANFSASIDLCAMFEAILNEVYSKRMISIAALEKVSEHHRQWAACFQQGLAEDGIQSTDTLDDGRWPNIGLLHVKEAYYWTIMLLTRPFLVETVSSHINSANMAPMEETVGSRGTCSTTQVLVHACIDSAIRTLELLRILLEYDDIPKRLPFVVNSIFVSALVLGLGHFGDVGKIFPLDVHLKLAHRLLGIFPHDALARRNMTIVEYLMDACDTVTEKRIELGRNRYSSFVKGMFGRIDEDPNAKGAAVVPPTTSNEKPTSTTYGSSEPDPSHHMRDSFQLPIDEVGKQSSTTQLNPPSRNQTQMNRTALTGTETEPEGRDAVADPFMERDMMTQEGFEAALQFMSPTTLWFDSYDETSPLFSTMGIAQT
ncbi:hypothetical protein PV04_02551 [Phialophora macrospora]|uniref:Zn(2)-C6 fungal-type domain-containing protein n=1 Tax=Phialophora macrospora TaxID=1851006 RepID=A0A0D2E7G6_9EURO|nr:hypothetical protein PV04_02551 [Phialophora macrospora]